MQQLDDLGDMIHEQQDECRLRCRAAGFRPADYPIFRSEADIQRAASTTGL